MKHSKLWAPPALRRVRIKEKTKVGECLIADDISGVVSLAQMDVLEIHTWNSVKQPDEYVDCRLLDSRAGGSAGESPGQLGRAAHIPEPAGLHGIHRSQAARKTEE